MSVAHPIERLSHPLWAQEQTRTKISAPRNVTRHQRHSPPPTGAVQCPGHGHRRRCCLGGRALRRGGGRRSSPSDAGGDAPGVGPDVRCVDRRQTCATPPKSRAKHAEGFGHRVGGLITTVPPPPPGCRGSSARCPIHLCRETDPALRVLSEGSTPREPKIFLHKN